MSSDYIITNKQIVSLDDLKHYGVLGMKWGVRRAQYKAGRNEKLREKAGKYDVKAAKLNKESEKAHSKYDLGGANKAMNKAAKYNIRAAKLAKKAVKADNEYVRTALDRKSKKFEYKAAKKNIEANRIAKSKGYGATAMKYSIKSDVARKKAAKARMKIANNELYIKIMERNISTLSKEDLKGAYSFVNGVNLNQRGETPKWKRELGLDLRML